MATICKILKNGTQKCWQTRGNFRNAKIEKKCEYCGKVIMVYSCLIKIGKGRFCSQSCRAKIISNVKGKHWNMPESFVEKARLRMIGKNNPNYRHGLSRIISKRYWNAQYKNWRKSVFQRDNYTCQVCGKNKCYVTAHHIKSWINHPKSRFDINNGKTLCEVCHSLTDNYKGRAKSYCD